MFGRKKKKEPTLFNSIDDSRSVVYDFMRRFVYESYRTVEYCMYPKLEEQELKAKLDVHLDALLAGEVDDGNANMLDQIIFAPAREGVMALRRQHYNHQDTIRRLIARRKSDRQDFSRISEERKEELAQLEWEYQETCRKLRLEQKGKTEKDEKKEDET